ncbi:XtrA/YqaO family protein [Lysinibacillus sphaericus]|uniref:XtrA/YqaO family protein n=1 Tax=Lysinibacillus sphaericus TaxID=1421 RepID=UPI00381F7C57
MLDGILNINIMKLSVNCVIILLKGKAIVTELPEFAETKIITQQGQVKSVK